MKSYKQYLAENILEEAEYQYTKVTLNKPRPSDKSKKKYMVYVKNDKENVSDLLESINFDVVYHGTDSESARSIEADGIDMMKSEKGYFGRGFYTTPNESLAKSNYADFSGDDEGGVVLKFKVLPDARILDLRDSDDYNHYQSLKLDKELYRDDIHKIMVKRNIDGIYDDSFDGVVFYNPKVLKLIK